MQAIILSGGKGERLRPITLKIPKPMIEIEGKPFLYYQINLLKKYGINEIILSVGYLKERIIEYFKDGFSFGVEIKYSCEGKHLGTGGALKLAEKYLENNFFVIYGDSYLDIDYNDVENKFRNSNKKGLVVLFRDIKKETGVLNNIALDNNLICKKYKKNANDRDLEFIDAGISMLKKDTLSLLPSNEFISLEDELFPALIKEKELIGYISIKRFYDIGTQKGIKELGKYIS